MTDVQAPEGVGWTALLTAAARAQEHGRPDRLFADPWAGVLVDAARRGGVEVPGPDDGPSELWEAFSAYFTGRTPFFDAHVQAGLDGGARQLVVLAAGLDARATRLDLPIGTVVYEVDQASVLGFKGSVLAADGLDVRARVPVPADLTGDWTTALRAAGFRPSEPSMWLAEGLLMYLDRVAADRLLDTVVAQSAPGSAVALEYFGCAPRVDHVRHYRDAAEKAMFASVVELFAEGPGADPTSWLAGHGVRTTTVADIADELRRLRREVPEAMDPRRTPGAISAVFAAGRIG